MAESKSLPSPNAEQRRVATAQYDRANQVIAGGDFDYGIQLLKDCCKIDPANMIYRKALRATQKVKHKENMRGGRFAGVTSAPIRLRLKKSRMLRQHRRVLECAEDILTHNPWDVGVQVAMSEAFAALDALEAAVWSLEQALQKDPKDLNVNRRLARMYEKTNQFTNAHLLWAAIRQADPRDEEAQRKSKELAASETISRGNYEAVLQNQTAASAGGASETDRIGEPAGPIAPAPVDRSIREVENLLQRIDNEPHDAGNYLQLAAHFRRHDQWDKVRDTLQRGLDAAGNHFELAVELADADIQPFRANLEMIELKLQQKRDDANLQQEKIKLLKEINTRELNVFRQKADRFPTDMSYRLEMGVRLLQLNQLEEAIGQLQMARTDPRFQWRAFMYLGFCFKERKNWRLAQRNFEDALRHLPPAEDTRRKEILFQLASGCAAAGDVNSAIEWGYELANEDFAYKDIGKLIDQWQNQHRGEEQAIG